MRLPLDPKRRDFFFSCLTLNAARAENDWSKTIGDKTIGDKTIGDRQNDW
jgi:hypothetical protein